MILYLAMKLLVLLMEYIQLKVDYLYDNYILNNMLMDEDYIHEYELDQIMNIFENFVKMLNVNQDDVLHMFEVQKMNQELKNNKVTMKKFCHPKITIKKNNWLRANHFLLYTIRISLLVGETVFYSLKVLDFLSGREKYHPKSRVNLAVQRADPSIFLV